MLRKIIKYGIVAAIIGTALGLTFYFLLLQIGPTVLQQSQIPPTPTSIPGQERRPTAIAQIRISDTPDKQSKILENPFAGYTIQFPSSWIYENYQPADPADIAPDIRFTFKITVDEPGLVDIHNEPNKKGFPTIEKWIEDQDEYFPTISLSTKEVRVGGVRAIRRETAKSPGSELRDSVIYSFIRGANLFEIGLALEGLSPAVQDKIISVFDKTVSTLTFR